jgi:hypothetical protein
VTLVCRNIAPLPELDDDGDDDNDDDDDDDDDEDRPEVYTFLEIVD